jgi:outer membrane protein OmpA-like peptidoglycan-associated protein
MAKSKPRGVTSPRYRHILSAVAASAVVAATFGFGVPAQSAPAACPDGATPIANQTQLADIKNNLAGTYCLTESFTVSDPWTPIGDFFVPFTGKLYGKGHTITLDIQTASDADFALFGAINTPTFPERIPVIDGLRLTGEVTGTHPNSSVSALAGNVQLATVSNVYSSVDVVGAYVGGLVQSLNDSILENSCVTGDVEGSFRAGGLVQYAQGSTITNSCFTGSVSVTRDPGGDGAGGFFAFGSGVVNIENSFAAGPISAASGTAGGLAPTTGVTATRESFWDTETTGQASSDGGIGKTTEQMKSFSTFNSAGWDIANGWESSPTKIWGICDGITYPFLRWATPSAPAGCQVIDGGGGGGGGGEPIPDATQTPTPTPTPTPSPTSTAPVTDPLAPITVVENPNIPSNGLPAGESRLLVNGAPAAVTVKPNKNQSPTGLVIDAPELNPPFRMTLEGRNSQGNPLGLTGDQVLVLESQPITRALRAKDGRSTRVQPSAVSTGRGFKPNSPVKFYLLPSTEIGTLTTDAQGNYSGQVPVPAGLRPGVYTLQTNGLAPNDSVRSLSLGVMVKQARSSVKALTASDSVFFNKLSAELTPAGKATLRTLVKTTGRQVLSVRSVGYVQPSGASTNDARLSTQRARIVADYLKSLEVRGAFKVRGNGVAKESGAAGRRVDVTITYRK